MCCLDWFTLCSGTQSPVSFSIFRIRCVNISASRCVCVFVCVCVTNIHKTIRTWLKTQLGLTANWIVSVSQTHKHRAGSSAVAGECFSGNRRRVICCFLYSSRTKGQQDWKATDISAQTLITDNGVRAAWSDSAKRGRERERERMCCSKRGLYWRCESAVKHSGASCYRPYKGQGPCVSAHLGYS